MTQNASSAFDSNISSKISAAQDKLKKLVVDIKDTNIDIFDLPKVSKPVRLAALDGSGFSHDFLGVTIVPSRAAGYPGFAAWPGHS